MIEWEKRSDGSERYITDLTKVWDGMNVVVEFVPSVDEIRDGKLVMTLRDDRIRDFSLEAPKDGEKGGVLATYEALVQWVGETEDGLLKFLIRTANNKGSNIVTRFDASQGRLLKRYDNFIKDFRDLSAWFMTERGAGYVNVDDVANIYWDDKLMMEIEQMIGESKLSDFYESGLGILREGMYIEIDMSLSWKERGSGSLSTRIFSERGDEGYLEAMVNKLGDEPLFMNITKWDVVQRKGKKREENYNS